MEELEQCRHAHSETQRQLVQQNQEQMHLEQERQHLMEELTRWQKRYLEAQRQNEQSKQDRRGAEQEAERLAQEREQEYLERERLLEKIRDTSRTLWELASYSSVGSTEG
jgi:hypothetical protein